MPLLRSVDYAWRLLATGFAFATLGLGGFAMAVTIIPAANARSSDPLLRARRAQAVVRGSFRFYILMLQALGVIRLEVVGANGLAQRSGYLVVANHPTLLDVVLIMSLVPRAQCIVKHQLWRNPLLRPLLKATGYIRNDQDADSLIAQCRDTLAAGNNLIIFPEGTRSVPGVPLSFQRGFAHIATLAGVDLQPITIWCHPITLIKGEAWYSIPKERPHFRVEVGELIEIKPFLDQESRSVAARRLVSRLESYYSGKLGYG